MKREEAKKIITQHNLISGKVGRAILLAIKNDLTIDANALPPGLSFAEVEKLRVLYNFKKQSMDYEQAPRNLIFYHLIQEKFPEFSWQIHHNDDDLSLRTKINIPRVKNLRPSLLSLLLDRVNSKEDSLLHRKYSEMSTLPFDVVQSISDLMEEIAAIYPSKEKIKLVIEWLKKGLQQQPLTIFSPVCPDYSVEPTGDPECPYRHTFNELGSGLGLIAQRILVVIPKFAKVFEKLDLKIKIIVGFGDFEAYSQANLTRLGITKNEFLSRVTNSKKTFEASKPVATDVHMITDLFGGYTKWLAIYKEFTTRLNQGNFGNSQLTREKLLKIVRKRKSLYDRWYGKKSLSDHIPQLLAQGAEYAAMGAYVGTLKNCLVLGADNDAMEPFYSVEKSIPTMYLKRFYC